MMANNRRHPPVQHAFTLARRQRACHALRHSIAKMVLPQPHTGDGMVMAAVVDVSLAARQRVAAVLLLKQTRKFADVMPAE
ncbi:Uncharacterised protein [Cronobacter sakazakii]|nr:Uncharacterised protein [Cronobacter sakazakii]